MQGNSPGPGRWATMGFKDKWRFEFWFQLYRYGWKTWLIYALVSLLVKWGDDDGVHPLGCCEDELIMQSSNRGLKLIIAVWIPNALEQREIRTRTKGSGSQVNKSPSFHVWIYLFKKCHVPDENSEWELEMFIGWNGWGAGVWRTLSPIYTFVKSQSICLISEKQSVAEARGRRDVNGWSSTALK